METFKLKADFQSVSWGFLEPQNALTIFYIFTITWLFRKPVCHKWCQNSDQLGWIMPVLQLWVHWFIEHTGYWTSTLLSHLANLATPWTNLSVFVKALTFSLYPLIFEQSTKKVFGQNLAHVWTCWADSRWLLDMLKSIWEVLGQSSQGRCCIASGCWILKVNRHAREMMAS